jgi:hypothetical protein
LNFEIRQAGAYSGQGFGGQNPSLFWKYFFNLPLSTMYLRIY